MQDQSDDVMLYQLGWLGSVVAVPRRKRTGFTFWSFYRSAGFLPTMPPLISPSSRPSISSS